MSGWARMKKILILPRRPKCFGHSAGSKLRAGRLFGSRSTGASGAQAMKGNEVANMPRCALRLRELARLRSWYNMAQMCGHSRLQSNMIIHIDPIDSKHAWWKTALQQ
ncbi:hypothetical protein BAUCODRAFT_399235 [Baudoinia panamericana UAMH 10762]|uniref:Uncharacterized protein n=1 Tax=Baudoinia panamericana (strain UAMH 10762) TaxID=717646 RepID=M2LXA4_BAUPA|nr:uncharacterized protein BAUCODRAFT_399235 [Baudoinia panamericana UAMH 10762]EMC99327.1 hypothetical protein BAUCODRAFT_399235 [Baudoinia panamericana UAMH 10762]